jgi:parvulin-like peptidyl-prolyl isomerase
VAGTVQCLAGWWAVRRFTRTPPPPEPADLPPVLLLGLCLYLFLKHMELYELDALIKHDITPVALSEFSSFGTRLQTATEAYWADRIASHFLERRSSLDTVTLSLIRFNDADLAQELYFQLLDGELHFAQLLERYSKDPEQLPRCMLGPAAVEKLNPHLARLVERYKPGELIPPIELQESPHLIRIERFDKARLDDGMRQQLLLEMRQKWLLEQMNAALKRLRHSDQT